ncbi:MAG: hypothetical protein O3C20_09160 [Verrucomicrobia bacterium]|nr:hypothetical protein [Verrucomicrobiota bacterium]
MNLKNDKLLCALCVVLTLGIASLLSPLTAQEDDDEDIYELTPFSIDEQDNVGYLARSSLAGTRLKAPLRDIAATISVVTEEFLDDTGSTDLQELLVYTANTEVLGIGGNFANPNTSIVVGAVQDSQFRNPAQNTRVRGLASADLTREYFPTSVAFDSYNTSRIVINRGANAILFGLGSPAGIINNQIKAPVFEDHAEVSFQVGSYDSQRGEIDFEKVLIEDKLSIRLMAVNEERKYQQDPAFEHDQRFTAVGEWRPFENSTIRLSYESGDITANRPRTLPPQDMVTRWFDVSPTGKAKPTHDPHNLFQLFLYDENGVNVDNLYWGPIGFTFEAAAVYAGPEFGIAGGALPNGTDAFVPIINNRFGPDASNGIRFQSFVTIRGVNQLYGNMLGSPKDQNGNSKSATRDFYVNEHITDTSLFDFRNLLFDGPNKREMESFDVFTGSLEQTFLEGNAGLAYHFNKEDYSNRFWNVIGDGSRFGAIGVDVNVTYPNGDANPNFGRLFASAGGNGGRTTTSSIDLENHRFTGFFKFDATEKVDGFWGELLGDHTLTALLEDAKRNARNITYYNHVWDDNFQQNGNPPNALNVTAVGSLVYLSDSIANQSSSADSHASNLRSKLEFQDSYSMSYRDPVTKLFTTGTFGTRSNLPAGGSLSKNHIESKALILHSGFLEDHLVATYGYREDDVKVWTTPQPPRNNDNTRDISPDAFFLPSDPTFKSSTDSSSWGVVAHVPDEWMDAVGGFGLSFHFSKSENSQIGSERNNLRGESLGPVSGSTEEKGFTVSFLDDRFSIRVNKYETLQLDENSGLTTNFGGMLGPYLRNYAPASRAENIEVNLTNRSDMARLANYDPFRNSEYLEQYFSFSADQEFVVRNLPANLTFPTDLLSEGLEIEAVANLTENWRLMFNISQQEVSATNTAPLLAAFIQETMNPVLAEYGDFNTSSGQVETISSWTNRTGLIANKIKIAEDGGKKTNEIREWRWNLVTNYNFDNNSGFRGFNVGGAVRWQDEIGIGRPILVDPELSTLDNLVYIPDLAHPYFGPTETMVDAWVGWEKELGPYFGRNTLLRIQLNVRNLLDENDLIPVVANPDGTIPVIRIPAERTFELSGSLSY